MGVRNRSINRLIYSYIDNLQGVRVNEDGVEENHLLVEKST